MHLGRPHRIPLNSCGKALEPFIKAVSLPRFIEDAVMPRLTSFSRLDVFINAAGLPFCYRN